MTEFNPTAAKLTEMVAFAVAQALAAQSKSPQAKADKPKADRPTSDQMDQLVIKLFRKAGFTDVQPRINVMTYNKWIDLGPQGPARREVHQGQTVSVVS